MTKIIRRDDKIWEEKKLKKYKKISSKPGPLLYPLPAAMVSCGTMENSNIITIAWTGIINTKPPYTYISVMKSRHSNEMIRKTGEFVINLAQADLTEEMDFCGVRSGLHFDKFETLHLTKQPAEQVKAPMIAECPVSLECKVFEIKEFPSHDMFMAEIVAVHIAEDFVTKTGAYNFGKMKLLTLKHGNYYATEKERRGFFGFSIMKPNTKKKNKGKKREN